ncbi:Gfo/Idh/MocA family oxidoreductase [bacterium SCSIO 12643]|nr:Gfo/Idh/MocA family oxidoreductase [bacterium SCSIO 12643]
MKKNFAIIGCGHIANRHVKHIQAHHLGNVVGVFDIDSEKMKLFCEKYNITGYGDFESLINDDRVDVVNICTPNGTHAELAIKSINAGKHTVVEKPMSISVSTAREMQEAARNSGVKLFIVKQNRYNPPVKTVKELMLEGKLNQPFMVSVNCFWNRNESYYNQSYWRGTKELDGGTLYTQFSHFVDILYYLFGEIEDVKGTVDNMTHNDLIEFEDSGSFIFKFKNGGIGNLNFTTSSYEQNMEGSISIFSDNATIKIGGKYLNTIDYQITNGFDIVDIPTSSSANNYGFYEGSMSNHDKVIDNVIETLNGRQEIMTNSEEGVKVIEMIAQFYDAAK